MPLEIHKTVFISYRRSVGAEAARTVFLDLNSHSYDTFMDVESINAGQFDQIILNQIEARAHFVLILTPGTLERCDEENDWLRREIEYAIEKKRNIIPLFFKGFHWNDIEKKHLTRNLVHLASFNGIDVPHDYFDAAMEKLRNRFMADVASGIVIPTPTNEISVVEAKIIEATKEAKGAIEVRQIINEVNERSLPKSVPIFDQIAASLKWYNAWLKWTILRNVKHENKIATLSEILALNPQHVAASHHRGVEHYTIGHLDEALVDLTEAIRLNPHFASAYNNRAIIRYRKGDFNGSVKDLNEAIKLNPEYAKAYSNRGIAYFTLEKYQEALADFQRTITLDSRYKWAFAGVAITQYMLKNYTEAKRIWQELVTEDKRYRDADWVGQAFYWRPELVEVARKLIATL